MQLSGNVWVRGHGVKQIVIYSTALSKVRGSCTGCGKWEYLTGGHITTEPGHIGLHYPPMGFSFSKEARNLKLCDKCLKRLLTKKGKAQLKLIKLYTQGRIANV